MSSRFHNKFHRHNHHTNPSNDPNYPDSAHDPIASPESPFQGTFALNGMLSASGGITVSTLEFVNANVAPVPGSVPVITTDQFLSITVNGQTRLIRLWRYDL
jgi:hypothetical protein